MVGQWLPEVIAEIPAQTEPIGDQPHQLALGAEAREEHHQLQLEEDARVDAGPAPLGGGIPDHLAHDAQFERLLHDAHHRRPFLPRGGAAEEAPSSHPAGEFFNSCSWSYGPRPGHENRRPSVSAAPTR
jgi:hypothetical protein